MIINIPKIKFISTQIMFLLIFKYGAFFVVENVSEAENLIYILVWANVCRPRLLMKPEQQYFIDNKCHFQNCFLTTNRSYFSNITNFHALLFNAATLKDLDMDMDIPVERSGNQLYVFMNDEPPVFTVAPKHYNGFFNLTWTYKLDSDIFFKYVTIKDDKGKAIGPKINMNWIDFNDMEPTSDEIKNRLQKKSKAALWFVSDCETSSQREVLVRELIIELKKYNLEVDVCGACNPLRTGFCKCTNKECDDLIELDYYFYLSFENSMYEDYVSEKLLTATRNFAVPIVYGGANYTRFMPNGSYIDATGLKARELANIMKNSINDKNRYYDFFKWRRYYSLQDPMETPDTDEICAFCAFLNDYLQNAIRYKKSVVTRLDIFWMK